jgi:hypothetical protein
MVAVLAVTGTFLAGCGSANSQQPMASASRAESPRVSLSPTAPMNTCAVDPLAERSSPAAVQDVGRNQTVLFGGQVNSASSADTWLFDGQCWHQVVTSIQPSPRQSAAFVYDAAVRESFLFGGFTDDPHGPQTLPGDAWAWNGQSWAQLEGAPHFVDVAAAYDEGRHMVVVTGSTTQGVGTWTWDGSHWASLPGDLPKQVGASSSAICFDRSNDSILLFGGWGIGVPINGNTWLWNGTTWIQQHPLSSPSARFSAVLVCGAHPVLFGGIGGQLGPWLTDTWEWDGTDWQQRHPANSPTDPASFGVFDSRRGVIFIATKPSQTWAWAGTDWSRLT